MQKLIRPLLDDFFTADPDELGRRKTFLQTILYFGISTTILGTLLIFIANPQSLTAVALNGMLALFQIFILFLARKGYQQTASLLLILLLYLYCGAALFYFGGIRNPVSVTLVVVIMVAATLIGQVGIIIAIILTGGLTLWFAVLETNNALPQLSAPIIPFQSWVAYFSTVLAGAVVMYAWYISIRTAMRRAQQEIAQRKRADENTHRRIKELEALNTISQILVSSNDLSTVLISVGEKIQAIFDMPIVFIALLDDASNLIHFTYYRMNELTSTEPLKLGEGMTSQIVLRREPILINNNWEIEAPKYNVIITSDESAVKSSLGVPLIANERAIGAICLQETRWENGFREDDVRLLSTIASNVAIAIENVRLKDKVQQELVERKQMEAVLRESEERYRIISAVSSDYAFLTRVEENGQAYEEWVSDAFEAITGYTLTELQTLGGWTPIVHPDDRALDAETYARLLMNQRVATEMRIIRKDNMLRWVRMYAQPIWDETQQRVTKFYGAMQDITDRKMAEEDVLKSEARLRAVLNHIPYDLWVCDEEGRYVTQNTKAEEIAIDARGKLPLEIEGVPLEIRRRWHEEHEAVLNGQKVRNEYVEYDQAGNKKTFIVSISPIYNNDKVIGLVGMSIDITDLKMAEEAVRILNLQLEKKVDERTAELEATIRELEAFSYNISHSVRAPLRGIHGYASILADEFGQQLPATAQGYIQKIQAGARTMDAVINDLLAYNRYGRMRPSKTWVDIKDVFNVTLIALLREYPDRQIETRLADLPPAFADLKLLRVVVSNLLSNAIKFTEARVTAQIEVGYREEADQIIYLVKDNGVGFDMKFAPKLFKAFQRLLEPGYFDGTGIGLAITERIIQKHGGKIWVEAEPDQGAIFYFTLPAQ